jgi:hypothetical protein
MTTDLVVAELFADLLGFALCAPAGLDAHWGNSARGRNLLSEDTGGSNVESAGKKGFLVAVVGLDPGHYTVVVRRRDRRPSAGSQRAERVTAHAVDGRLCISALGQLQRWDPGHPGVREFEVEPGWYDVEAHLTTDNGADGQTTRVLELVIAPVGCG